MRVLRLQVQQLKETDTTQQQRNYNTAEGIAAQIATRFQFRFIDVTSNVTIFVTPAQYWRDCEGVRQTTGYSPITTTGW